MLAFYGVAVSLSYPQPSKVVLALATTSTTLLSFGMVISLDFYQQAVP